MPAFCAVQNCGDKYGHADNISFHKFPFKRQELMQKWLDFAQRGPDWQPSKWSSICSRHFREEDFNCAADRKILKKTAVPCLITQKQAHPTENVNNDQQHMEEVSKGKVSDQNKAKPTTLVDTPNAEALDETCEDFEEEEEDQHLRTTDSQGSPNVGKINCRLCGNACTTAVVSFSTNFEIYGMIQKCFPTLNIQKDDHLPKELCRQCLKRLESFSRFIDKVLETQSELQRKYRTEKTNNNTRFAERSLKVKQEPVVRVKQEIPEAYNSFLSDDLDMGMDEACEQEPDTDTNVEQKFDFCDFPMLNAQDIINNCDIMEIINLDDPFINIPDDDANTNCENSTQDEQQHEQSTQRRQQQQQKHSMKRPLPSAHELLQAHLLSEEHNYAYTTEDLKEEWQFKNTYKTEKTDEGGEYGEQEELIANNEQEEDEQAGYTGEEQQNGVNDGATEGTYASSSRTLEANNSDGKQSNVDKTTINSSIAADTRSSRPIVTSVSALGDTAITLPNNADSNHNHNEKIMVTAVNDMQQHQHQHQQEQQPQQSTSTEPAVTATTSVPTTHTIAASKPHTKPNIVVLDESIVKSSNAFQLHTCHTCHLKFFSMESLNQHYIVAHPLQTQLDQGAHLRIDQQKFANSPMQQQQQQQQQQLLRQYYDEQPQENLITHDQHYQHQQQHDEQQQQQQQQQQPEHLPMVSVPGDYMWKSYETTNDGGNDNFTHNCKIEKGFGSPATSVEGTHQTGEGHTGHTYLQPNIFGFAHSSPVRNTFITPNRSAEDTPTLLGAPNAVRILEMKRTFLRQHELYSNIGNVPQEYARATVHSNDTSKTSSYAAPNNMSVAENALKTQAPMHQPPTAPLHTRKRKHSRQRARLNSRVIARLTALERKINAAARPDAVSNEYRHLRRRFKLLQRKCKSLEVQILEKQVNGTKAITTAVTSQRSTTTRKSTALLRFCCRICQAKFKSIQRLLQHKRTLRHWARRHRMPKRFAATCCGCEKFFRHKIALRNHMRYICQALPLCWFKMQMQTFKCRYCRRSTFNHWRLYRRHEVKCKSARQRKSAKQRRLRATNNKKDSAQAQPLKRNKNNNNASVGARKISSVAPTSASAPTATKHKLPVSAGAREYACTVCAKVFSSSNSLNQHSITHTDQRRHKCRLCERAFKRRNGLTQHVRGFHLQLKPHQCAVCQRSYALKSDMLRCRHAAVKRASGVLANKNQIAGSVK